MTKYKQLATSLKTEIRSGYYSEGERIPSLREIQSLKSCSLTTAKEAYRILEEEGYIFVVPQSGYLYIPIFAPSSLDHKMNFIQPWKRMIGSNK